jgi:capsular exopolysaccharide synthesis family protein
MVATNLALSLGELGSKRILLVDADLRAGSVTRVLKLNHLPGMGEFLQGKRQFDTVIHPTQFPNLSVAPTGLVPKNTLPAILEGSHWPEFMEQAKEKFDLIIVDTVPVSAPVADLELLMAPCDGYLLVVHMRQTRRQSLKRVSARLDPKKCLGVILNNDDELYDYAHDYYYVRPSKTK